jgi:hypothetical protein
MTTGFVLTHARLVRDVWHESHEASALDSIREVTLLLGAEACSLATVHASVWVHVMTKTDDVLVVDVFDWSLLVNVVSFCLFHIYFMNVVIIISENFRYWDEGDTRRRKQISGGVLLYVD